MKEVDLARFLEKQNVKKVYFCSGARNSHLLGELDSFQLEFLFDERQASFMALGEAKASGDPVVVCTTSGSAVAECLPAVVEAYHSKLKLIIISADRPKRLHHTNAPQTIDQQNIFSTFIRYKIHDNNYSLLKKIDYPLHINIEVDDAKVLPKESVISEIDLAQTKKIIESAKKPLVLFTHSLNSKASKDLFNYFESKNMNLYCESISNLHSEKAIQYDHTLIKLLDESQIDLVIKVGETPISKIWRLLDHSYPEVSVLCLGTGPHGLNRGHFYTNEDEVLSLDLPQFERLELNAILPVKFKDYPASEFYQYELIFDSIAEDSLVFLGNSMPVRYGEFFKNKMVKFMASRGCNGIDGQIATAIGVAKNVTSEVHLIIGDLTFLYDLNSCLFPFPKNLTVHVIDNNGGRIFERINLDSRIINAHHIEIENVARSFNNSIKVYKVNSAETETVWSQII